MNKEENCVAVWERVLQDDLILSTDLIMLSGHGHELNSPLSFALTGADAIALETLYGGRFILSTQLIKPNHLIS